MLQLQAELNEVKTTYAALTVHFQPIFAAKTGKIFGYEALARHRTKRIDIKKLFENAKTDGSLYFLDMICRRNAMKEAKAQKLENYLFINVCPETLLHPNHEIGLTDRFAEEFELSKEKIVLEITEHTMIENYEVFLKAIDYYKTRGYKIAIDDFGAGFGGPKLFTLVEPDMVKIDRYFISGLKKNSFCRDFIAFTVDICHKKDIMVLAEGIETQTELIEILKLDVDLLQGYLLGMPAPNIIKKSNGS